MNFKDLQYSIGKFKTDVHSQIVKNNPLQKQDTKALSLWIFQERNDLASMRTMGYERSETIKALKEWIKEEIEEEKLENARDLEDIVGDKLCRLLQKQNEIEQQYAGKYQKYRHAIKSIREREEKLSDQREKKRSLQSRIQNLSKTSPKSPKLLEFQRELKSLLHDTHESEMDLADFKRFALKEAFYLRFNAMHEYAEKTALIAGFGKYLTDLLDIEPTSQATRKPYEKGPEAALIFADAMSAIQEWKPALEDERPTLMNDLGKGKAPEAASPPQLPPRPQEATQPTGYTPQEVSSVTSDHKTPSETEIDLERIDLYDAPPPAYERADHTALNAEGSFSSPYLSHPYSPHPNQVMGSPRPSQVTDSPYPMHAYPHRQSTQGSFYDDQQQQMFSQMNYSQLYRQMSSRQQPHRPYAEFQQQQRQRMDAGGFRIPAPTSAEDEKERLAQHYQQQEQHYQQQEQHYQHKPEEPMHSPVPSVHSSTSHKPNYEEKSQQE